MIEYKGIKHKKVNLFFNWYEDNNRQHEIDEALGFNKELFNEVIVVYGRPTFKELFELTKEYPNDINCFCNSDIYFTSLDRIRTIKDNECFAITREDLLNNPNAVGSQDAWVFSGIIKEIDCNFTMGMWGCLSGETIINYNRGKRSGYRTISLDRLFKNKNSIWNNDTPIYSHSINNNGDIINNKIINVIQSGVKETIKLTLNDNSFLILTKDHRVCTEINEYKEAQLLNVGDSVVAKGSRNYILGRKKSKKRPVVYLNNHPNASKVVLKGKAYYRVPKHRLVVEAELNNMSYECFVFIVNRGNYESRNLKFLTKDLEVHHIDEDSLNNDISNLQVLTKAEHAKLHYEKGSVPKREDIIKKEIIKIEPNDSIMTYDIQMESPNNNFIANGIVVHNCDNRLAYEIQKSGYNIINPSLSIKLVHLHKEDNRNYKRTKENTVDPPYLTLQPCK